MRSPRPDRPDAGYGLVEVLVALAILGLAATGGIQVMVGSLQRQAADAVEREALSALRLPFERGEIAQGQVELAQGRVVADWRVAHADIRHGNLAGVPAQWVTIEAVIEWENSGQIRTQCLERVEILTMAGSP